MTALPHPPLKLLVEEPSLLLEAAVDTALPAPEPSASEVAEAVTQLVRKHRALPDEAVRDLRRLLSHDLARRNAANLRLGHLRLLIEMFLALDPSDPDPWVSQVQYMAERDRRAAAGEIYPAEGTLRNAYGRWVSAVRAAARFVNHGGQARVPASHAHAKPRRDAYSPREVMSALIRCRHDLGDWPSEWEYHEWARIKRHLAAVDPRLPVARPIEKCLDGFAEALRVTRSVFEAGEERPSPQTPSAQTGPPR